ncbi:hypothetical protein LSH36_189g01006 [Paralvinella palmiformis]|uniref:Uncharacterized protein n=1 Tax=Paralvinella palmiformis TaxID=53620 RepID=A0AAD9N770_9ANNE|nr:hypothetical protein LSH36_189g01006 [Paralvinella palmiformis]
MFSSQVRSYTVIFIFMFLVVSQRSLYSLSRCRNKICSRQQFAEYPQYQYTGNYLVYDGPWPYHVCERLCRQYLECTTFVMKWTTKHNKFGFCGLITGRPDTELINISDQHTMFGPEPAISNPLYSATPCVASSIRGRNFACKFALDGLPDTMWKAFGESTVGDWIELKLEKVELVAGIVLNPGCNRKSQCGAWRLTISETIQTQVRT